MIRNSVTCSALATDISLTAAGEPPSEIQWMAPGEHPIQPLVNGEPAEKPFQFNVTAAIAATVGAALQSMRASYLAGEGDEPYLDFYHEDRERSGIPTQVWWGGEDPKSGGIRMRVNWLAQAAQAIKERRVRKISPQWEMDPHTFEFVGVTENLGGLVIRSAFTRNTPVMAKAGSVTVRGIAARTQQIIAQAKAAVRADRSNPIKSERIDMATALVEALHANPDFYPQYRRAVLIEGAFGRSTLSGGAGGRSVELTVSKEAKDFNAEFMQQGRELAEQRGISLTEALTELGAKNPGLLVEYRRRVMTGGLK